MAEDKIYLTIGEPDEDGRMLCALTEGQPQLGDEHVRVLSVKKVKSDQAAKEWCKRMMREKPWESRQ